MRKGISDLEDVFFSAREQAIFYNKKVAVLIYPKENRFGVEGTAAGDAGAAGDGGTVINSHSGRAVVATLPSGVAFALLDIYRQDYMESEPARIWFQPDGTADEAVIVLLCKGDRRKITLEYATGMPTATDVDQ
jgi:hypothetical protein